MRAGRKKWSGGKVAAAAIICAVTASTAVYAGGVKFYHMYQEKQGNYGVVTGVKTSDSSEKMVLPEKVHDIDMELGYIPEGMEWIDESHLEYPEHGRTGGFSFASVLLDDNDFDIVMQDRYVVDREKKIFGNYEGVYLEYHDLAVDGSFDKRIYLLCPEEYRVLTIYIGDDVTKEEAIKVAENIVIKEKETMLKTAGMYTWSELIRPAEEMQDTESRISVEEGQLKLYSIGESLNLSASGEDTSGHHVRTDQITVSVDSVQVADNLSLLDQDLLPEEWKDAVGDDGKLKDNTLSYIQSGDGINTLDEVAKTEKVSQKLVYATVTYTNNTDEEIRHMLYHGSLMLLNQENGLYQVYDPKDEPGSGYDYVMWDGAAKTAEMSYCTESEDYGDGGNYISSLKAGESIQVNMAWIVNEKDLDHMYLNLNGDGAAYEFSDNVLKTGLVKLSQE